MGLTIGVDIGGTKIAAGVVDEEGNILSTHKVPTPGTAEGIVDAIASAVEGARAGHAIVGVGIGAAGYVNRQRSEVYFAPNIHWRNEPLKEKVETRVGLPVVVENDANAAAWGEYKFGAGKGHRNVICITLGTGLGGGIIIGNKLRRGHYGVAAEFGHIRMVPDGLLCGCGSQGCWEQYASGRALVRYAKQRANATPENAEILLGLGDGSPDGIEGKHISMLYAVGLFATEYDQFDRPGIAIAYYVVLCVWTLATLPRVQNAAACTKRFLAVDLTIALTGIMHIILSSSSTTIESSSISLPSARNSSRSSGVGPPAG